MTTFQVPSTGTYRTADGSEAISLVAGTLIELSDAARYLEP